ncbi:phage integrase N-terminal SAM-like domain-containing protein [Methylotuvimicrobium sp. KM1]|uniref:phage integrase N-terminal SAM-like domain-containing protein n=1 Tax=Methylotuvimicrobium sp. KM1 TaxID=3377707 RepID=UPI00384F9470
MQICPTIKLPLTLDGTVFEVKFKFASSTGCGVRKIMRLKHYSLYTERTYCDWIKQFVKFRRMTERQSLFEHSEAKFEAFLTHLAT